MGCGMLAAAGVLVGLVVVGVVEGVVVRPVVGPVLPVLVPPVPVVGGVVVPPVPWPVTAIGINKPTTAAAVIALTQFFEAILPPWTAHIIPPKIALRLFADVNNVPCRTAAPLGRMGLQKPMLKPSLLPAIALLAILTACSETPSPSTAKKEPEKVEPVTGQSAVFKMYQMARAWAPDSQVMKLQSMHLTEVKDGPPGTAPAWQATFVSTARSQSRSYTFSIVEGEGNLHKGAFAGLEESWSGGPSGMDSPFLMAAIKIDTDAAYKTAMEDPHSHAAEYDKKNPGKPITIFLEKTPKHPDPAWRIIWGESAGTSNFSVLIDASTGEYVETLR